MKNLLPTGPDASTALACVRERYKGAYLSKDETVIAALKGGEWHVLALKDGDGWRASSFREEAVVMPKDQFPAIPPTALEIYCKLRGWSGGTIHQALRDFKEQAHSFRQRVMDELPKAAWDTAGRETFQAAADELLSA